jgi:thymidylate kinase
MNIIIIEGSDGTGKSSLFNSLTLWLQEAGQEVSRYKFPTQYPHPSQDTYEFYLNDFKETLSKATPTEWMLIDRSFVTTLVYQGYDCNSYQRDPSYHQMKTELVQNFFGHFENVKSIHFVWLTAGLNIKLSRILRRKASVKDALERLPIEKMAIRLANVSQKYFDVFQDLIYEFQDLDDVHFSLIPTDNKTPQKVFEQTLIKIFKVTQNPKSLTENSITGDEKTEPLF